MGHRIALIAVCALLALPSSALAQVKKKPGQPAPVPEKTAPPPGPAELRPKVEALLSGYEFMPSKADWAKLGPGALDVLDELARDGKQLPSRRSRAIASMGQVDDPRATERLTALAKDTGIEPRYRGTAAEVLSSIQGETALPTITPLLSSADPLVRETAARSIARIGTTAARKTLETRLEKEQDAAVREAIQRGLAPSR